MIKALLLRLIGATNVDHDRRLHQQNDLSGAQCTVPRRLVNLRRVPGAQNGQSLEVLQTSPSTGHRDDRNSWDLILHPSLITKAGLKAIPTIKRMYPAKAYKVKQHSGHPPKGIFTEWRALDPWTALNTYNIICDVRQLESSERHFSIAQAMTSRQAQRGRQNSHNNQ